MDRSEEEKREIVEGKNLRRKVQSNLLVIEDESDPEPEFICGTSMEEIDAYYNKLIAEFSKTNKPICIQDNNTNGYKTDEKQTHV